METQKKKLTNGQLFKKINSSLVFVPRDKEYKWVFFDDKMVKLEITQDYAVISTGSHRHVFDAINQNGYSRPYIYTKKVVEIALENDCKVDGKKRTFEKLLDVLSQREDKAEYHLVTYFSWWLFNIFNPLYQIGENDVETFVTYESYIHNIARSAIILSEKESDMTNKQFINEIMDKEKFFVENMNEIVLFPKLSDKEMMQKEIKALEEIENERTITEG